MIAVNEFAKKKSKKQKSLLLKRLLVINNIIPYLIWKKVAKKIEDIEFVDTFRFAVGIILFPLNLILQTVLVGFLFGRNVGWCYVMLSLIIVVFYSKK